jgi:hypothetical protein
MEDGDAPPRRGRGDELPEITFSGLVLSLSAGAMLHLGETPEGATEAPDPNLPLARQTIDILGMLEEKTRGNLSGEEERLLHQILFDLRMRYARKAPR